LFFTILDSKQDCLGFYYDGDIHEESPNIADHFITWDYNHHHHCDGMEYLSLYCDGASVSELCPPYLQEELEILHERKVAFGNAIRNSKIDISSACLYDLIPHWFLKEYSQIKCEIMKDVHSRLPKPENYDFMLRLENLFGEIQENTLNIDMSQLAHRRHQAAVRNFMKRIGGKNKIKYNQFGTRTGRLTVSPSSFPILNLQHSFRSVLKPNNDLFVEFDYNAAELRTMMALAGVEQPQEDVHEWNMKNIFSMSNRDAAKKRVFSWLYNPSSTDKALDRAYNRKKVLDEHWDGSKVTTPFGRQIEAQEHYALNYTIQSTTSDLVLRQVLEVEKLLRGKKSKIVFLIHDSFVIDLDKNERNLILQIAKIFSQGKFGDFLVNVKAGKDFGNMKEINL
jgi:hypothetical protein